MTLILKCCDSDVQEWEVFVLPIIRNNVKGRLFAQFSVKLAIFDADLNTQPPTCQGLEWWIMVGNIQYAADWERVIPTACTDQKWKMRHFYLILEIIAMIGLDLNKQCSRLPVFVKQDSALGDGQRWICAVWKTRVCTQGPFFVHRRCGGSEPGQGFTRSSARNEI